MRLPTAWSCSRWARSTSAPPRPRPLQQPRPPRGRAAGTSLLGDYEQLERRLHGGCEARCPLPEVERGVATAEQFPRRLAEALRRLRR